MMPYRFSSFRTLPKTLSRISFVSFIALSFTLALAFALTSGGIFDPTTHAQSSGIVVTISPTTASVLGGQSVQFTATGTGTSDTGVTFDIRNSRGEPVSNGGTISPDGLYTAPVDNSGTFYIRAASVADPSASALAAVAVGESFQTIYTNDFNLDTATTIADLRNSTGATGADGTPDYQQNFSPANLDPDPAKANNGTGLRSGQQQFAIDTDATTTPATSTQVDVVSDAATAAGFAGSFTSNALALYDNNTSAISIFSVGGGKALQSGSLTFKFYEPNLPSGDKNNVTTNAGLRFELGNAFTSTGDPRVSNRTTLLDIRNGTITATGRRTNITGDPTYTINIPYTLGAQHTLTVSFDRLDTSENPNGTYSVQVDNNSPVKIGYANVFNPDRFSIETGDAVARTTKATLIDDISFAGTPVPPPAPSAPPTAPVLTSVNFNSARYATSRLAYGLNGYSAVAPTISSQPLYAQNMRYMKPGLVRFHYGNLVTANSATDIRSWVRIDNSTSPATVTWDRDRIRAALDAAAAWNYPFEPLITIPDFPPSLRTYVVYAVRADNRLPCSTSNPCNAQNPAVETTTDANGNTCGTTGAQCTGVARLLDPSSFDAYADFCAELVRIVNVEQGRGVKFFEVTNERDEIYYVRFANLGMTTDRLDQLVQIYNLAAQRMKQVDPTVQTGGPAFARGDLTAQVRRFVQGTANVSNPTTLDFLSYHFYASGNLNESDAQIYNRTKSLARHSEDINNILAEVAPNRAIPSHLNEYNISFTFTNNDPRMQNHKGAVFDALAVIAALDTGTDATNAWNDQDGIYGKMDGSNNLRVGGNLFQLANNFLVGTRVLTSSSNPDAVTVFAVRDDATNRNAYLVVNRSSSIQQVKTDFNGFTAAGGSFNRYEISASGYYTGSVSFDAVANGDFYVPDNSVTLLALDAPAVTQDVTNRVTISRGGFTNITGTNRFTQIMRITNPATGSAINAPVALVLASLSGNAALVNKDGDTVYNQPGSPFVNVSVGADNVLSPGETATVRLEFTNSNSSRITYTPRVLAGAGAR